MTDLLVYVAAQRVQAARALLSAACQATGLGVRLETYGTGALYERLGPRRAAPFPDVVLFYGPYAARAAAVDGLLQPYQPARTADAAPHDTDWRWTSLDFSVVTSMGQPAPNGLSDLASAQRLAIADPERSEAGLSLLLATLAADAERGWQWWQQRAQRGLVLAEDEAGAVASVTAARATHAVTFLGENGTPVAGLAPLPHAVGLPANSRNVDAARRMLDWLNGPDAAARLRLSPWQVGSNGLQTLLSAAPPLDVEWGRQHYTETRQRWAQSAFGPTRPQ